MCEILKNLKLKMILKGALENYHVGNWAKLLPFFQKASYTIRFHLWEIHWRILILSTFVFEITRRMCDRAPTSRESFETRTRVNSHVPEHRWPAYSGLVSKVQPFHEFHRHVVDIPVYVCRVYARALCSIIRMHVHETRPGDVGQESEVYLTVRDRSATHRT